MNKQKEITCISSPNFSSRGGERITTIILHHTVCSFKETIALFTSTKSEVSAHYVIGRKGKIYQMVKEKDKAWHAGKSSLSGRNDVNRFSIGIELVGDGKHPFTGSQYDSCAYLCRKLKKKYGIKHIAGHKDIAPRRKTDPSPFDWKRFYKMLGGL